jgi:hypothetical protein
MKERIKVLAVCLAVCMPIGIITPIICDRLVRAQGEKPAAQQALPAVVAFPDSLKRDCEYINTQITLLIERRDRLVAQEQIRQKVGPEYDVDYERLLWRLKALAGKETKP